MVNLYPEGFQEFIDETNRLVLEDARSAMLSLVEDLPESQELFNFYKNFIKEYKALCLKQKLPTNS